MLERACVVAKRPAREHEQSPSPLVQSISLIGLSLQRHAMCHPKRMAESPAAFISQWNDLDQVIGTLDGWAENDFRLSHPPPPSLQRLNPSQSYVDESEVHLFKTTVLYTRMYRIHMAYTVQANAYWQVPSRQCNNNKKIRKDKNTKHNCNQYHFNSIAGVVYLSLH